MQPLLAVVLSIVVATFFGFAFAVNRRQRAERVSAGRRLEDWARARGGRGIPPGGVAVPIEDGEVTIVATHRGVDRPNTTMFRTECSLGESFRASATQKSLLKTGAFTFAIAEAIELPQPLDDLYRARSTDPHQWIRVLADPAIVEALRPLRAFSIEAEPVKTADSAQRVATSLSLTLMSADLDDQELRMGVAVLEHASRALRSGHN